MPKISVVGVGCFDEAKLLAHFLYFFGDTLTEKVISEPAATHWLIAQLAMRATGRMHWQEDWTN